MTLNLGCIVEGHGEESAVPVLLRRYHQHLSSPVDLNIPRPVRVSRGKLIKPDGLRRAMELVARQLHPPRAVLLVIDADDDCPAELGPRLLEDAQAARPDIPVAVVLAKREFEAWFLAAIESLAGKRHLPDKPPAVDDPEGIRDAKRQLTRLMSGSHAYSPTNDQAALAAVFDIQAARSRADSFDKCCREIERLFDEASRQTT